jgi:hypothetical protein
MKTRNETARCPECGMDRSDWPAGGYTKGNAEYCCEGCAEGTGCTCAVEPVTAKSSKGTGATQQRTQRK